MCIRYWTKADDYIAGIVGGALVVALAFVGLSTARSLNPMSTRYELLSVAVATPTKLGTPVEVSVLRRIYQDFNGRYVTTVRRVDDVAPVCNGGLPVPYRAMSEAQLEGEPQALIVSLDWWTEGAKPPCQQEVDRLTPGQFVLTTCIHDETGGLMNALWPRFVCRDSNLFEVVE
jgi:hypothetical protein